MRCCEHLGTSLFALGNPVREARLLVAKRCLPMCSGIRKAELCRPCSQGERLCKYSPTVSIEAPHTRIFRRIARPAHAGTALHLLAVVTATPRRRALSRRTRDAPCFPKNPRALGIHQANQAKLPCLAGFRILGGLGADLGHDDQGEGIVAGLQHRPALGGVPVDELDHREAERGPSRCRRGCVERAARGIPGSSLRGLLSRGCHGRCGAWARRYRSCGAPVTGDGRSFVPCRV